MKKMKRFTIFTISIILVLSAMMSSGCSQKSAPHHDAAMEAPQKMMEVDEAAMAASQEMMEAGDTGEVSKDISSDNEAALAGKTPVDDRKLVKTLRIDMQTMTFDKATAAITVLADELGGYVEQANISGNSLNDANDYSDINYSPRNASFTLRIPAEKLNAASDKLNALGNITSRSESIEDVTSNYTDIERRLETLNVQEDRLLEMLKTADELEYMITLERELADVCYEIESYTILLNGLDNKITYSTINIWIDEVIEYDDVRIAPPTFGERVSESFSNSINAISAFGKFLVIMLAAVVPFLLVWGGAIGLLVFLIRKFVKTYRHKHPKVPHVKHPVPQAGHSKSETAPEAESQPVQSEK